MKKILISISISFIAITLLLTACYFQQQGNQFSTGIEKMRNGVTSEPLYLGKEQIIRFDKYTGTHIYLTKYELADDGLCCITGNIDFVVFQSKKRVSCEELYVVLRNQFILTYQIEDGLRRILEYRYKV